MTSNGPRSLRDAITVLFSQGRFEDGMSTLGGASQMPQVVKLECLGNLHFYKKELQMAVDKYEAAISIDPTYMISRYQYLVGTQDEKSGDFVDAFKRYQAAIDIEPSFVDPYVELGGLLVKIGDLKGAAQCYRDAISLAPSDLSVLYNLKSVLAKLNDGTPETYAAELAKVEAAYAILEESGAVLPEKRCW